MEENALTYEAEPELIKDHGELSFDRHAKLRSLRYNSKLMGRMQSPSGYGKVTGTCGKTLEIYLRIRKKRIEDAICFADDFLSTRRCGSAVAEISRGRTVDEVTLIGGDTILALLNGLPKGEVHCAFLAAEALHAAIDNWSRKLLSTGKQTGKYHKVSFSPARRAEHP